LRDDEIRCEAQEDPEGVKKLPVHDQSTPISTISATLKYI
jgi:hypothetical protein